MGKWSTFAVLLALSCRAAPGSVDGALVGSGLGIGAAGLSRAAGGCLASCRPGQVCDAESGLCVDSPCGPCGRGEACDEALDPPRCVTAAVDVTAGRPPDDTFRQGVPDGYSPPPTGDYLRRAQPPPDRDRRARRPAQIEIGTTTASAVRP